MRLLKNDKSKDVIAFVEDIQTFPMNEQKEVSISEFLQRLDLMSGKTEATDTSQEEEKVEHDLNIEQIIEEAQAVRQTKVEGGIRTSTFMDANSQ